VSERNATFLSRRLVTIDSRCGSDRPRRSSFQTPRQSPGRIKSSAQASAGRSSRARHWPCPRTGVARRHRNSHTRRAYARAADEFLGWCASVGVRSIADVQPVHVATWIEAGTRELAAPSVKQQLAAVRHLFDWLVTGQVVPVNPAASVRGPRHVVTCGQTPVLDPSEARALLDSIDVKAPRWRTMPRRARHSFTIAGARSSPSMRSSGSEFKARKIPWEKRGEDAHSRPVTSRTAILYLLRWRNLGRQCRPHAAENDFRSPLPAKRIGISCLHCLQRWW
jgi:hypothetical protein